MKVKYEGELVIGENIELCFDGVSCKVLVDGTDISNDCVSLNIHLASGQAELTLKLAPKIHGGLLARQELKA